MTLNHDQLIEEWEKDANLDRARLQEEMFRQPILHAKYLRYLQEYKVKVRKHHLKFDKIKKLKTRYYNGELGEADLVANNWKQYPYTKPSKTGMETLLAGDEDLQLIVEQIEYLKILIDTTESILREIHARGYLFKTLVDYQKFEAGAM